MLNRPLTEMPVPVVAIHIIRLVNLALPMVAVHTNHFVKMAPQMVAMHINHYHLCSHLDSGSFQLDYSTEFCVDMFLFMK
jgi:hypothetical protein